MSLGVHEETLDDALASWPWLAADWYRRKAAPTVRLEIIRDARPGEPVTETVPDEPVSLTRRIGSTPGGRFCAGTWTSPTNARIGRTLPSMIR
ncbi:hypothetical protein NKG94_16960 [Micromonospora sp. M12]